MTGRTAGANSAGATELWLLDRDATAEQLAAIEAAAPRLAAEETIRAAAITDREQARWWTAGRTALRLLLETRCGTAIRQQAFTQASGGRPMLEGFGIDFSLADSGSYLLIAITPNGRIGVDVELPRRLKMAAERIELLAAAGAALGGSAASPLQSWCRIEAFAKAAGPSLAATLARLGVQGHGAGRLSTEDVRLRAETARMAENIEVVDLALPHDLTGAVAGHAPFPTIRTLDAGLIGSLAG